jgi:hypothetical protein
MTWHPTNWRPPETDKDLRLKFRNGETSKYTYTARQIRWTDTASDFDVIEWRIEQ